MNLNEVFSLFDQSSSSLSRIHRTMIDSRYILPSDLFVALKGARFDGHDFLAEVAEKGAVAAVVSKRVEGIQLPQIVVPDTEKALVKLADYYRGHVSTHIIALTGSNGKTTVKEMIAGMLPAGSFGTKGNLNNHIGVPLSILMMPEDARYAVFELGANHLGEIDYTAKMVKPKVALINNIAPVHIGEFGSLENIAIAKGEIYQNLGDDGIAIVNEDDAFSHFWDDILGSRTVIRFSTHQAKEVFAKNILLDENGLANFTLCIGDKTNRVHLKVPGIHMVNNALAAASCAYASGLSIDDITNGLTMYEGFHGRFYVKKGLKGSTIIDDTYNANLPSVMAGLDILAKRTGKKIMVLGDMAELGEYTVSHHQAVGIHAKTIGIDNMMTVGEHTTHTHQAFGKNAHHFENKTALIQALKKELSPTTTILIKGARNTHMEDVVSALII